MQNGTSGFTYFHGVKSEPRLSIYIQRFGSCSFPGEGVCVYEKNNVLSGGWMLGALEFPVRPSRIWHRQSHSTRMSSQPMSVQKSFGL